VPSFIVSVARGQSSGHFPLGNPSLAVCLRENCADGLANDFSVVPSEDPAGSLIPCGHPVIEIHGDDRIFDGTLKDGFEEAFPGATGIGKGVHHHIAPDPSSH
jgi:hypothetical protein